jgi:hypothetical protein
MPRPKNPQPSYLHHKATNQAYCRIPDGNGGRRTVYLGLFNSPESKVEHARILAQLAVSPTPANVTPHLITGRSDITINEVSLAFWQHTEKHYRRADGTTTNELIEYKYTFRVMRQTYAHVAAREFGPLALKVVRQKMIDAGWKRTTINNRVRRIKHVFKWAVENELLPT